MPTFTAGFQKEFDYLSSLNQLSTKPAKPENEVLKLLKKMEVLKTLLSIGDTEFIQAKLALLEDYQLDANVQSIYTHLTKKEFDKAHHLIQTFSPVSYTHLTLPTTPYV